MSNTEFKARALYDFVAEGSNELSFSANEILTITSSTAGHGWWYAKNSSGRMGVIPENYVQALADPPEPNEPPPAMSTFSHTNNNYPNLDVFGSNNNTTKSSYSPPAYDQHQYMNPGTYTNNWQTQEASAWPSSPPLPPQLTNLLDEQNVTSSIQPLKSPPRRKTTSLNTRPTSYNSCDGYTTVIDVQTSLGLFPIENSSFDMKKSSVSDQSDEWYYTLPKTPAPANTLPTFDLPESPILSKTDTFATACETTHVLTHSISNQVSSDNHILESEPTKLTQTNSMPEELLPPVQKKTSRSFIKFFTLSRKPKTLKENQIKTKETNRQISKKDTDSDDSFSDSEYPTAPSHTTNFNTLPVHSTLSSQVRSSIVSGETSKSAPRARFFDKHGLDNYLLNGGKGKSPDEHVEITYDDREGGVCWSPNPGMPPFTCRIEEPSKGTKLGGLKAFTEYKISPQIPGKQSVNRRYKQFDWLHEQLVNKFRFISIPPLPGKQIAGRFEQDFIKERQRLLELWLNRVCRHPVLCASVPVQHFITCDGSDKNKKEWKGGKRRIEKDEFRDASWLQCVTVRETRITEDEMHSQIEIFAHQQPGLESQFRNLSQGLTKYIERYTDTYERDIQKISELFSKVHLAVHNDTTTPGNKELSNSIQKISGSYNEIAESYKTKGSEGLRNFNERIQEYIGLLGCFPSILSIQKSASDFMKTVQQRGIDASDAARRYHDLNHVVLAEINFFQKQKVIDLNEYLKEVVDEQTNFYGEIAAKLRQVTFNGK
ncbi:unnamed protein product [Adineta ricciae]|uniref:Sorting nexin n=1 Tax=Adineta ricciae TaxID=249248 RepID=A0A814Z0M5_ADIRI|nr:unnamed protein product [Adineta ricciae]